jgi:hypothetical protein
LSFDYDKPGLDPLASTPGTTGMPAEPAAEVPLSAAMQKFRSCRWRKPGEDSTPECCSHRDVLPITGVHGFDPEAWCPECTFFKLRRTPKKRPADEYSY